MYVLFMDKEEELIYDLIFSDRTKFEIDISDYISDIYEYKKFVTKILMILRKSKVEIVENRITTYYNTMIWYLKLKR
jgi:hypothetical protein